MEVMSSRLKKKKTNQIVIGTKLKSQQLGWHVSVLASIICISVQAPLMLQDTCRFWHNMPLSRRPFQGYPAYFNKTMPRHILHIRTAWLRNKRVRVLDWPVCSRDLSYKHQSALQVKSYMRKEWQRILLSQHQQLVSSVPKCFLSVVWRKGDVTKWKNASPHPFWQVLQASNSSRWVYITKINSSD